MSELSHAILQVHADLAVRAPETLDSATLFKIGTEMGNSPMSFRPNILK